VIRGRVVAGDTGRPLRRALVRLSAPGLGRDAKTATTNADGRYEIKDLPGGRYTLTVTRSGYLQLRYGQRRAYEQPKPLQVADRQVLEHVDFAMPRMSVLSGRVFDETGDPIEGVTILALRSMFINGYRQLVPVGSNARLSPMTKGDIGSPASLQVPMSSSRGRRKNGPSTRTAPPRCSAMPTYYPGVDDVTTARKVTVGVGTQATGLDFALIPGRTATISGTAFTSRGRPFGTVNLGLDVRSPDFASFGSAGSATVRPDGTFTISNVSPGEYMLSATMDRAEDTSEVAILPVDRRRRR
jgi:hypothetical protein